MSSCRRLLLGLLLAAASASAQAPLDVRVALVIGNSAYAGAPLVNPANDAKAMSAVLRGMGFVVVEARDASRVEMEAAVTSLRESLIGRHGVGMLYYAGHGLQLDWHNYMVPVDAKLAASADVARQTVDVQSVLDVFKAAGNRMSIVVLDACRDNPFAASASARGLAPMDAPPGTFLAYATAPGNVAEDGDATSANGLYTQYLVTEIARPGARIEDVFKRVRLKVRQGSQGRQIPWEATSLGDDFVFSATVGAPVAPVAAPRAPDFAAQKDAWDKIKASTDPKELYAFLDRFPTGEISEAALSRLNQLSRPQITAAVGKGESANLAYTGPRFRVGDAFTFRIHDRFSEKVVAEFTRKVVGIDDGVVSVVVDNGTTIRYTLLGATIEASSRGKTVRFDPPQEPDPAEFYVGKRWQGQSTYVDWDGIQKTATTTSRIVGTEQIELPAGRFDTYVIELTFTYSNGVYEEVRKWVDPRYGISVKRETIGRRGGQIVKYERREMVAVKADRS